MPQQGGQCPFCQLISQPEQLNLVGETENFYAWLEVNPRAKGHTMVVPKEHKENLLELNPSEWQEAMKLTREVVEKAKDGLGADGASVAINIEEAGGQMLPHAYIIIFPRFQEEENAGTPTGAIFPQRDELQGKLNDIKEAMASVDVDFGDEAIEPHPESQQFTEKQPLTGAMSTGKSKDKQKEPESSKKKEKATSEDSDDEEVEEVEFTGKSFEWR